MVKKISLLSILFLFQVAGMNAYAANIEVFHINEGKVVKEVPANDTVHKEVEGILKGITDIFREFEPIPKSGQMVKIPLDPAIKVENQWFHALVSEVILIFPEYENPHLMLFDDENNAFFFTFDASVDRILDELKLKLNERNNSKNSP
ncbi:hypothetical protein [Robertmurraya andreesenii]|uniref:Group-specific protein n=1 Tax=Anoxybacillus andreesenii TaxID=1325932 RepID=A0ABT9V6R5_9BACL|nr:hypothetical protein [Robertmurraya andreesenii]MDQ0156634.1 hypothetical protein [Robertmurraya andreesenii]